MSEVRGQTRRDRARQTRRRIVSAAHTEFCANGYQGTTMAAVAARAQVAVQTVYFVFHTKTELLTAVFDSAVLGEQEDTPPDRSDWFLAAAEPDPRRALGSYVAGTGAILARVAALSTVVNTAAQTDPDIASMRSERERLRVEGYRAFITTLHHRGTLRAGTDIDAATDILLTLLGPATYHSLVAERGWTHDRYLTWVADALAELLLLRPSAPRRKPR